MLRPAQDLGTDANENIKVPGRTSPQSGERRTGRSMLRPYGKRLPGNIAHAPS
jgi:hypothetical protein